MITTLPPELREQLSRLNALELLGALTGQPLKLQKDPDTLLTRKEAAAHLGLTVGALARMKAEGRGPKYLKPDGNGGKLLRYRLKDLDSWLNGGGSNAAKR